MKPGGQRRDGLRAHVQKLEALQKPPNLCKIVDFPSSFVGYGISQNGFRPSTSSLSCCRSLLFGWCAAETLRSAGTLVSFVLWKLGLLRVKITQPYQPIPISNQIWRLLWPSKCTTPGQLLHIAWHSFQAVFSSSHFQHLCRLSQSRECTTWWKLLELPDDLAASLSSATCHKPHCFAGWLVNIPLMGYTNVQEASYVTNPPIS